MHRRETRSRRPSLDNVVVVGEFAASPRGIEKRVYAKVGPEHAATKRLTRMEIFYYATGHFLNDATASCWFSYLLLYLQDAQRLNSTQAGIVLLSGQFADALATPLTGALSDRSRGVPSLKLGRRKLYILMGYVIVLFCFYGVFGNVALFDDKQTQTYVLAFFAALFNIGWAAVQVAHMSMVPELTDDEQQRVQLNSARHAFTVLANLTVFSSMGLILRATSGDGKSNLQVYKQLCRIVLAVGLVFTAIFILGTPENLDTALEGVEEEREEAEEVGEETPLIQPIYRRQSKVTHIGMPAPQLLESTRPRSTSQTFNKEVQTSFYGTDDSYVEWSLDACLVDGEITSAFDWLKLKEFYQVATVYMLVRLATNVSQVYLSFYVTSVLNLSNSAIATVPLLLFACQFVAAAGVGYANASDRRVGLTLGGICYMIACIAMFLLHGSGAKMWVCLVISIALLGVGATVTMVLSVSLEADLVGTNTTSGAFLYGAISLTDKFASGVVIFGVQALGGYLSDIHQVPKKVAVFKKTEWDPKEKDVFLRTVNSLVPCVAMLLAVLVVWTIRYKNSP
jgi:Na+/melibiose symporter-like transporter